MTRYKGMIITTENVVPTVSSYNDIGSVCYQKEHPIEVPVSDSSYSSAAQYSYT